MIGKRDLATAIAHALDGEWAHAHRIVQQDEQSELACWIHAVLHRQEGDLANAGYWYARCGRSPREGVPPESELREINEALTRRRD